jgi:hypothetical protein
MELRRAGRDEWWKRRKWLRIVARQVGDGRELYDLRSDLRVVERSGSRASIVRRGEIGLREK